MEVQTTEDYTVFDPGNNKPKAIIVSTDAIHGGRILRGERHHI